MSNSAAAVLTVCSLAKNKNDELQVIREGNVSTMKDAKNIAHSVWARNFNHGESQRPVLVYRGSNLVTRLEKSF